MSDKAGNSIKSFFLEKNNKKRVFFSFFNKLKEKKYLLTVSKGRLRLCVCPLINVIEESLLYQAVGQSQLFNGSMRQIKKFT